MATKTTTTKSNPAAKKVAPRTDYKAGTRVKVTIRGAEQTGRVTGVNETTTGKFIQVNVGDAKNPVIKQFRPAAVRGY